MDVSALLNKSDEYEYEGEQRDESKAPSRVTRAYRDDVAATGDIWEEEGEPAVTRLEHYSLPLRSRPQHFPTFEKSPQQTKHSGHRPLSLALDRSNLASPSSLGDIMSPWPRSQVTGSTSRHKFSDSQSSISTHFTSVSTVQSPASSVSTAPDSYFMSVGSPDPWNPENNKLPLVREESPDTDELAKAHRAHHVPSSLDPARRDLLGLEALSSTHIDFARARARGISEPGLMPRTEAPVAMLSTLTSESKAPGTHGNVASHREAPLTLGSRLPAGSIEEETENIRTLEDEDASQSTISRQASYDTQSEENPSHQHPSVLSGETADAGTATPASSLSGALEGAKTAIPQDSGPVCMFISGCDTEASLRKAISHFFGRNKACTLRIPEEAWIYWCRKHYQRVRYRNSGTYGIQQMELVIMQIDRLEAWSMENLRKGRNKFLKDWVFALRKRARNDPVPDWMSPMLGHVQDTPTVRRIAQRLLKDFESSKISSIPEFEFLPNILGEDEDEDQQKPGRGRKQKRKAAEAADEGKKPVSSGRGDSREGAPQKRSRTVEGVRSQYADTVVHSQTDVVGPVAVDSFGTMRPTLPSLRSYFDDDTLLQLSRPFDPSLHGTYAGSAHDQHGSSSQAGFSMPHLARSVSAGPEGGGNWFGGRGTSRYRQPGGQVPFTTEHPSIQNSSTNAANFSFQYRNQAQAAAQHLAHHHHHPQIHGGVQMWPTFGSDVFDGLATRTRVGSQPSYHTPTPTTGATRDPRLAMYATQLQQFDHIDQMYGGAGSGQRHVYDNLFSMEPHGTPLPAAYSTPTTASRSQTLSSGASAHDCQLSHVSMTPIAGQITEFSGSQAPQASRGPEEWAEIESADSNGDERMAAQPDIASSSSTAGYE